MRLSLSRRRGLPALLAAAAIVSLSGCGRTNPVTAKRIKAVEKGLMRSVYLKGLPSEKLTLA
ncbi:MAG: hypothetical protein ACYDH3_05795, partial [Candidatus Aminicenantales bacterium]